MKVVRVGGEYLKAREHTAWKALFIVLSVVLIGAVVELSVGKRSRVALPVAVIALVAILLEAKTALPIIWRRLRAVQKGRLGERLTAQLMSRLSDDYYLFNDMVFGRGNVDHVVVGPCGVVVIETKRVAGTIRCDGDSWTVNGYAVKSYSKQVKEGAIAVRSFLASADQRFKHEYVRAVVVVTNPHCRVEVNHAQAVVVRFSELLPFIATLTNQRQMAAPLVEAAASALSRAADVR